MVSFDRSAQAQHYIGRALRVTWPAVGGGLGDPLTGNRQHLQLTGAGDVESAPKLALPLPADALVDTVPSSVESLIPRDPEMRSDTMETSPMIYLNGAGSDQPKLVYGIFVSLFVFFNCFAINQWLQYRAKGRWNNYLFGVAGVRQRAHAEVAHTQ